MMNYQTYIHELDIPTLVGRKRIIRVFVPDTSSPCPVLYMHDGQNLVDEAPYSGYSWDILTTASRLIDEGIIPPLIIVGIDNDSNCRIEEYSSHLSKKMKKYFQGKEVQPEGEQFSDFIVTSVLPLVETKYNTIPEKRGIAGSSCGGNISYYMGSTYPSVFEVIGAFSPAYHVIGKEFFQTIKDWKVSPNQMIYHDMGMKETRFLSISYLYPLLKTHAILRRKLHQKFNIKLVIDPKATHTELFWQARFEGFLKWAYQNKM